MIIVQYSIEKYLKSNTKLLLLLKFWLPGFLWPPPLVCHFSPSPSILFSLSVLLKCLASQTSSSQFSLEARNSLTLLFKAKSACFVSVFSIQDVSLGLPLGEKIRGVFRDKFWVNVHFISLIVIIFSSPYTYQKALMQF